MDAPVDLPPPLGSGGHGADAYRPSAGIALFHRDGRVWMGKRRPGKGSEVIRCPWQLPQGGIEKDESPVDAAWRELLEETGTDKAELLCESREWLYYDLPEQLIGYALDGKYRGQRQKWFAMRFTGEDADFAVAEVEAPEFVEWGWFDFAGLPEMVEPFRRKVYERLVAEFSKLVK
ncbi:MAG: RNA pyrophosphohydrolase [Hyphomicrobiales bacterium]|nr:RNA pyrophosphohydrolase [Hyphomicrobiales bacterium]